MLLAVVIGSKLFTSAALSQDSLTQQAAQASASGSRPTAATWATDDAGVLLLAKAPKGQGLAFCATPKVASTLWKVLLHRISGNERWYEMATTKHYDILPKFGHGLAHGLKRVRWDSPVEPGGPILLDDPNYTKIAFFRDPLERVLSGYLDKCQKAPDWERVWSCHGPWIQEGRQPKFDELVNYILTHQPHELGKHFRPQVEYCGMGVEGNVGKYDVIADMDKMADETERIMKAIGLTEYLSGWPTGDMFDRGNAKGHSTGAGDRIHEWYSPDTQQKMQNYYAKSYDVFNKIDTGTHIYDKIPWMPDISTIFAKADKNDDGVISAREDLNGDGLADSKFDSNGDGLVERSEYISAMMALEQPLGKSEL